MRSIQVVPGQVVEQLIVEGHDIGQQQVFMEVDELLLDSAVKTLDMGIHFGGTRVGMPMSDVGLAQAIGEVFGEFAAVVGEDDGAGHGEEGLGKLECRAHHSTRFTMR